MFSLVKTTQVTLLPSMLIIIITILAKPLSVSILTRKTYKVKSQFVVDKRKDDEVQLSLLRNESQVSGELDGNASDFRAHKVNSMISTRTVSEKSFQVVPGLRSPNRDRVARSSSPVLAHKFLRLSKDYQSNHQVLKELEQFSSPVSGTDLASTNKKSGELVLVQTNTSKPNSSIQTDPNLCLYDDEIIISSKNNIQF